MNKKTRILAIVVAAIVLVGLVVGAIFLMDRFKPETTEGDKTITFVVVAADKTEKTYTIDTDAEYLADALVKEGILAAKDASGMYTVIDGIEAKWDPDQAWWNISKEGVALTVGMNDQPIADGEKYEATYTIGY